MIIAMLAEALARPVCFHRANRLLPVGGGWFALEHHHLLHRHPQRCHQLQLPPKLSQRCPQLQLPPRLPLPPVPQLLPPVVNTVDHPFASIVPVSKLLIADGAHLRQVVCLELQVALIHLGLVASVFWTGSGHNPTAFTCTQQRHPPPKLQHCPQLPQHPLVVKLPICVLCVPAHSYSHNKPTFR